ncbi:MAG: hypothetical protein QW227_00335 [Candidatus Aenigmatarchaeota archaeon]
MGFITNFSKRAYKNALDELPNNADAQQKLDKLECVRKKRSCFNAVYELVTDIAVTVAGAYGAWKLFTEGNNAWHITAHMTAGYAFTKFATRVYDWFVGKHAILDYLDPKFWRKHREDYAKEEIEETIGKRGVITLGSLVAGVGIELAQYLGIVGGTATIDGFARTVTSAAVANGTSAIFDGFDDIDAAVYEEFCNKVKNGEL